MRERPVEWNSQLEELILRKSYENLDTAELTFVQSQISETDYIEYRILLLKSKQSFAANQIKPKADVQKKLAAAMAQRSKVQQPFLTAINQVLNYRMPAWQALTGAAAMLLCFFFFGQKKPMVVTSRPTIVFQTDTVFKKQPALLVHDTIYLKEGSARKQKKYSKASSSTIEDTVSILALNATKDIVVKKNQKVYGKENLDMPVNNVASTIPQEGRSAKKDKALMDLLERVY